jgi:DNA-binding SARP family transcriptional activator
MVLGEQGRDEESLAMFRRVGTEAQAKANLAFVYTQRGDVDQAVESYSEALTLDAKMRPAAQALVQLADRVEKQNAHEALAAIKSTPQPTSQASSCRAIAPSKPASKVVDEVQKPVQLAAATEPIEADAVSAADLVIEALCENDVPMKSPKVEPTVEEVSSRRTAQRYSADSAKEARPAALDMFSMGEVSPLIVEPSLEGPQLVTPTPKLADPTRMVRFLR